MPGGLLEGKIAVVTGGAGGIGGGITRRLAANGATIVVNDIDAARLSSHTSQLSEHGVAVRAVLGDICDDATVENLYRTASELDDGRVDILVNNVGDFRPSGRFLRSTEAHWKKMHAINFEHVLLCTHKFAPSMVSRNSGCIINVSTVEAFRGIPGNAVYNAYNAAINAFTKSLAVELGRDGVRVNAIAPDLADTLQTPASLMLQGRDPNMIRHWMPLGRFGQPDDYGDVVVFLASDMSRMVTGHIIAVDGGTTAASGWYLRKDEKGWTNLPDAP